MWMMHNRGLGVLQSSCLIWVWIIPQCSWSRDVETIASSAVCVIVFSMDGSRWPCCLLDRRVGGVARCAMCTTMMVLTTLALVLRQHFSSRAKTWVIFIYLFIFVLLLSETQRVCHLTPHLVHTSLTKWKAAAHRLVRVNPPVTTAKLYGLT